MPKALQLAANYGFLTVVARVRGGVHCRCICGRETRPSVQALVRGRTRSCGCGGGVKRVRKTDPDTARPEYACWAEIKRRCLDPRRPAFGDYGGRGIKVCLRWIEGADGLPPFRTFLADVGPRPSAAHSIERIDDNGNYEPGNCRWATRTEQARNTRRNRLVTYRGETLCLAAMCEKHSKDVDLVWQRIQRYGWPIDAAIETASRNKNGRRLPLSRR